MVGRHVFKVTFISQASLEAELMETWCLRRSLDRKHWTFASSQASLEAELMETPTSPFLPTTFIPFHSQASLEAELMETLHPVF